MFLLCFCFKRANMDPLQCKHCGQKYDTMAQRRRHESFFCDSEAKRIDDVMQDDDDDDDEEAPADGTPTKAAAAASTAPAEKKRVKATHECSVCHRVFKLKSQLETHTLHMHMRATADSQPDSDHDDCGYRVQQRKQFGFPLYFFVCPLCTQGYRDERSFWRHTSNVHKCKTRPYQYFCPVHECTQSKVPMTSFRAIQLHLARHHGIKTTERVSYLTNTRFIREAKKLEATRESKTKVKPADDDAKQDSGEEWKAEEDDATTTTTTEAPSAPTVTSQPKLQPKAKDAAHALVAAAKTKRRSFIRCDYCDKRFTQRVFLKTHIERKHPSLKTPQKTRARKPKTPPKRANPLRQKPVVVSDDEEKTEKKESSAKPATTFNIKTLDLSKFNLKIDVKMAAKAVMLGPLDEDSTSAVMKSNIRTQTASKKKKPLTAEQQQRENNLRKLLSGFHTAPPVKKSPPAPKPAPLPVPAPAPVPKDEVKVEAELKAQ